MTQIIAIPAKHLNQTTKTNINFMFGFSAGIEKSCEKKSTTLGAYSKPNSSNVPNYLNFIFSKVENHHPFLPIETNQNSWPTTNLPIANC